MSCQGRIHEAHDDKKRYRYRKGGIEELGVVGD